VSREGAGSTFGERQPGLAYLPRPGAYGVAVRDGRILVVDTPEGRFLPGGGLDAGELPLDALRREMVEETGYEVISAQPIGAARQLIVARANGKPIEKRGEFFNVRLSDVPTASLVDADHAARWVPVGEASATLTEGSHAWAVSRAAEPD
jgi:8-oxo-dGTP diphosphatase